eukprot:CAMPEP_0170502696 /NCGR_PEP_ID=MMETSP0208-20121228/42320_1 /TAXON_ID=197538 /ORGANISM="Strombidium inclinatum, Strain S3" /LENGTH=181 /DNA_ID=CAMNT_0010781935 /DNA_START=5217 /DNA_END=5759 /DNA_ORIENTATION=+
MALLDKRTPPLKGLELFLDIMLVAEPLFLASQALVIVHLLLATLPAEAAHPALFGPLALLALLADSALLAGAPLRYLVAPQVVLEVHCLRVAHLIVYELLKLEQLARREHLLLKLALLARDALLVEVLERLPPLLQTLSRFLKTATVEHPAVLTLGGSRARGIRLELVHLVAQVEGIQPVW